MKKANGCYTNYNELMREAFRIHKERGCTTMDELNAISTELFKADAAKRKVGRN